MIYYVIINLRVSKRMTRSGVQEYMSIAISSHCI